MDSRYDGWRKQAYGSEMYWISPNNDKIAYRRNGRMVELTWLRNLGGGVGPKEFETAEDYVRRRFSGALKKRSVRTLAGILEQLEMFKGRMPGNKF
jgi:hypothetical protein